MNARTRIVALLRRADGLFKLRVERVANETPQGRAERRGDDSPPERYRERLAPLERRDAAARPVDAELLDAWERLGAVREIVPAVLDDVQLVLRATVLDPEGERPALPRLGIAPPPRPHRATAANPRAYRGTKDRPAKPARPGPVDLRPFLCVPGGQDRVVELLATELGAFELPDEPRGAPPGFARGFAWQAQTLPEQFRDALGLHHRLELERDPELRRAAAWFVASASLTEWPHVPAWLAFVSRLAPERRVTLLELLRETGAVARDPAPHADALATLDVVPRAADFHNRMRYALLVVRRGCSLADALAGCELADAYCPDYRFWAASSLDVIPDPLPRGRSAPLHEFLARHHACSDDPSDAYDALGLWALCCYDASVLDELDRPDALALTPEAGRRLGSALQFGHFDERFSVPRWSARRAPLRRVLRAAAALPSAYQAKALTLLQEYLHGEHLARLDDLLELFPRVAHESLAPESEAMLVLANVARLPAERVAEFAGASPRSFQVLERACNRRNDAYRTSWGASVLFGVDPALAVAAFREHPRALIRALRTFGLLSFAQRGVLAREVCAGPLAVDVSALDAAQLVELYDAHGPRASTSPIPRKLRRHVDADAALTPRQLERAADVVRAAWPAVRCEQLREAALARMAAVLGDDAVDLGALDDRMLHALELQVGAEQNRRPLRRLLRACHRGDARDLREHQANRAWLRAHPAVDAERWFAGVMLTRELPGRGTVTLALEHDPLEALRLGTYVGSCLGLGGVYNSSAAAIVLDVNKQVVFARDASGRFLARQVVALTEADTLACFHVYPQVDADFEALFREFDRAFAEHLSLPLARDDADFRVARTLAADWYDDGLIDGPRPESSATTS